jgi:hypothetical protein
VNDDLPEGEIESRSSPISPTMLLCFINTDASRPLGRPFRVPRQVGSPYGPGQAGGVVEHSELYNEGDAPAHDSH